MNGFWKRKLPAFLLAMVLLASTMPGALADEHNTNHTWKKEWSSNAMGHWHDCAVPGCSEKSVTIPHTMSSQYFYQNETYHVRKCTDCDYVMEQTGHNLPAQPSRVIEATCYQEGKKIYTCMDGCGYSKEEIIAATNRHVAAETWASDDSYHWHACTTEGCTYNGLSRAAHSYESGVYASNASQHWRICKICNGTSAKESHVDSNPRDGRCDACNYTMSAVPGNTSENFTLNVGTSSRTVGSDISEQIDTRFVSRHGRHFTKVYFSDESARAYGTLYADDRLTSLGSRDYVRSGSSSYPVRDLYFVPGTSSGYTVRYTARDDYDNTMSGLITINSDASASSTITYAAAPGERVDFRAGDFYDAFRKLSGGNSNLSWVEIIPTNAYEDFDGALYNGSRTMTYNYLDRARFYYDDRDVTSDSYDFLLEDLNFRAASGARDGDSVSLTYRAYSRNGGSSYEGTLKLVVSKDGVSSDTVTLRIAPGSSATLDRTAFNRVYRNYYNNSTRTIRYIAFDAGGDYTSFSGKLYASGHNDFTRDDLSYNGELFSYDRDSYSDYAINDLVFRVSSSARNGETLSIPFRAYDSNGDYAQGTLKIIADEYGSEDTIVYEVAPNGTVDFTIADFNKFYRTMSNNNNRTIKYVVFSADSSYNNFPGSLYTSNTALTRSDLSYSKTLFYYNSSSDGNFALNSLSFRTNSSARVGDSISISFRAHYTDRDYEEGTLRIDVTSTAARTIRYEAAPGGTVNFKHEDFNNVYRTMSGNDRRNIAYVVFDAPSAYTNFAGKIYSGSTDFTRSELAYSKLRFYYDNRSDGDYDLETLSFKATSSAKEGDTISIPFRAHYDDYDWEEGTLKIVISSSADGTVNYMVAPGAETAFRISDFNDAYRAVSGNSNRTIRYVTFSAPAAYDSFAGKLYTSAATSYLSRRELAYSGTKFFYNSQSYGDYALNSLTFKADSGAKQGASITIPFRAHYSETDYAEGSVKITVNSGAAGDISYTVTPGKTVNISRTDFNNYLQKTYSGYNVSYVVFEQPGNSEFNPADGTFYCGYGTSYSTSFSRTTLPDTRFYYSKEDVRDGDYELDDLTFAAASSFNGSVTLRFTAYSAGSRSVTGTLVIKPVGASATSNYVGSIRYAVTSGTNVQINSNDIARYYRSVYATDTLQYVTLNDVPSTGGLYYNYYSASNYGTASREQLTAANRSGRSFYMSPTSTSQYALTELTYVPSGSNYCVTIPFTAYGTSGRSVTGGILISVSSKAVSEVYGATPKNTAVTFPSSAIYAAVTAATGTALNSVQLLKLPAANVGVVYFGSGTATPATTTAAYTYSGSTQTMNQLRFVPANNYTGSVEIPYVALNANGAAIASGVFSLGVVNNVRSFGDVTTSTWCYKYVTELADASVIDGYADGSFKPNNTITYGAALKLVMLAAGYPEIAPTNKNSVFSGYLDRARADGLITRTNVNLSASITRLQVAQLAAGAMKLDINNLSSVKPFTDTADVYVQALNAAGIVEGYFNNGTSTFKPGNTLTRGQVSAIVWRMRNYNR